jgi:hypothetical protein
MAGNSAEDDMALSVFDDKSREPGEEQLAAALGRAYGRWTELIAWLEERFPPTVASWGFPGAKFGWSVRVKRRKRTILYMTPQEKRILVGFVLGERAVAAAEEAGLPEETLVEIRSARKYAEGRGVRVTVRLKKDVAVVKKLAEVKMAH